MTIIEETILSIKSNTAKVFNLSIQQIESKARGGKIADSRRCIMLIINKQLPELRGSYLSRAIKKDRSHYRKTLGLARKLYNKNKIFREKVDKVEEEIKHNRKACFYCKSQLAT